MAAEYKLVVLGENGVGKSSMLIQLINSHFAFEYDPTIEDSYRKQMRVDHETVILDILDTANQEEFSAMRDQYLRNGEGFLLLYDITVRGTFDEITKHRDRICRAKESSRVPMCLVATKCDLDSERKVTVHEGEDMARNFGVPFFETSSKTRVNIDEVFSELVRLIRATHPDSAPTRQRTRQRGANCEIS